MKKNEILVFATWINLGPSQVAFQVLLVVRILLPMQEMHVRSLGQGDPLQEGVATHSNILAWRIPWTEEPGGLQSVGHKDSDTTEVT